MFFASVHNQQRVYSHRVIIAASHTFWMKACPTLVARCQSALFLCVQYVVSCASFKQVFGSYARRVVAMVTSIWLGPSTMLQKETQSGCSIPSGATAWANTYLSVTTVSTSLPFPASSLWALSVTLIYVRPKFKNLLRCENWWCKIGLSHIVKLTLSDVIGSRGVNSASWATL